MDTSQGISFPIALARANSLFVLIWPQFENKMFLHLGDVMELLAGHSPLLDLVMDTISKLYLPHQLVKLMSVAKTSIVLFSYHLMQLVEVYKIP